MIFKNVLSEIICREFERTVGRWQTKKEKPQAFRVSFQLSLDWDHEEGYRYLDVLISAPMNYVQVWSRERWNVIPTADLIYDESGDATIKPGKDYSEGASEWTLLSDHDSCWRDGVSRCLERYAEKIITLDHQVGSRDNEWFSIEAVPNLPAHPEIAINA